MEILKLSSIESQDQVPLNEENLIMLFHQSSLEYKFEQLNRFLKQGKLVEKLAFPYPVNVFTERVQFVVTMLSQVLGLDNDI